MLKAAQKKYQTTVSAKEMSISININIEHSLDSVSLYTVVHHCFNVWHYGLVKFPFSSKENDIGFLIWLITFTFTKTSLIKSNLVKTRRSKLLL